MSDNRNRFGNDDYRGRDGDRDQDGYTYSSARDYAAAGRLGRDDRNFRGGGTGYGGDYRGEQQGGGYGQDRDAGRYGGGEPYRGSYAHDGRRFTETGGRDEYSRTGNWGGNQDWQRGEGRGGGGSYERERGGMFGGGHADRGQQDRWSGRDDDRYRGGGSFSGPRDRDEHRGGGSRRPEGYNYEERGFFDRAGDEVRSWFGDSEAERRRQLDQRQDEAMGGSGFRGATERDDHYHSWRREQIAQLDRDYDEYRREHGQKFSNEFGAWRGERQTQRECLNRVTEHMEVVGSDGQHVGTVDKVRGDRILLTKNDAEAGGRHHSIPSRWIQSVDDKVTIRKTLDEAKREWRDEERNSAFFGDDDRNRGGGFGTGFGSGGGARKTDTASANASDTARAMQAHRANPATDDGEVDLNRSFSGTYDKK